MKKITRILRIAGYSFAALFAITILSLFILYAVLDSGKNRKEPGVGSSEYVTSEEIRQAGKKSPGLNLLPVPRNVTMIEGAYNLPESIVYTINDSLQTFVLDFFSTIPGIKASSGKNGNIVFRYKHGIPVQGYKLFVNRDGIEVEYSSRHGLHYSLISLKVLRENYSGVLPCCRIEDYPDIEVRGVMLDISRNKVPAPETLKCIVQLLSDLKYNHLQLYIEGFSFAYPSYKYLWQGKETPITGDEIRDLDAFCRSRGIELVPNQNTFGHMMAWLATDEFKDLAECPEGYKALGLMSMKGTLDPGDPRSIELVSKMTDDLLPNFTSQWYNVNLDEPLELGLGKSKELVSQVGEGQVYLDYMLKVHKIVKERNRNMMIWGDVIMRHPDLLQKIPKDIILLDWGYEASYPFERHCRALQEAGISYMVCPGTNSWGSITGRTENMLSAIESAAISGAKHGAKGFLITDWGDLGHWQYLPVSYQGFAAGASMSWNCLKPDDSQLAGFLNSYVYRDSNSLMGNLALDLGRYSRYEEIPVVNMTTTFMAFQLGLRDRLVVDEIYSSINTSVFRVMNDHAPEMTSYYRSKLLNRHAFDYKGFNRFLNEKETILTKCQLNTVDGKTIKDEYLNSILLLRTGLMLQYYIEKKPFMDSESERRVLSSLKESITKYMNENQRLWKLRYKPGGYERSITPLKTLLSQIDNRLTLLEKSEPAVMLDEFINRIKSAGIVLALKAM